MIVYDPQLLQHTFVIWDAQSLAHAGFLEKEQIKAIGQRLPALKSQRNLFLRMAFFLLGTFLFSSVCGAAALFFSSFIDEHFSLILLLEAFWGFAIAELLARQGFYAHGLDDAAILGAQFMMAFALGSLSDTETIGYAALVAGGCFCALRYLHSLSVISAVGGMVALLSDLVMSRQLIPQLYLSVVLFIFGILLYVIFRYLKNSQSHGFYRYPLMMLEACGLLLVYFSMNYLVVRELAQELMHITVTAAHDVPLAPLFYFFTFATPVALVFFGLRAKNRRVLYLGFFTLGFSVFSIRYYYYFLPPQWALLVSGLLLAAVALAAIKRLRHRERGITFAKDRFSVSEALSIAQAVIVNSQVQDQAPSKGGMHFGGGGFSGGGAGESY